MFGIPLNYLGFGVFAVLVMFGDKLLPLAAMGLQKAYAGLKSATTTQTATKAPDALPSFSEAISAMELVAVYKAKCKDDPGYQMALSCLKTLEAS